MYTVKSFFQKYYKDYSQMFTVHEIGEIDQSYWSENMSFWSKDFKPKLLLPSLSHTTRCTVYVLYTYLYYMRSWNKSLWFLALVLRTNFMYECCKWHVKLFDFMDEVILKIKVKVYANRKESRVILTNNFLRLRRKACLEIF